MVAKEFNLTKINTFPRIIDYLRDELDWPIEDENLENITFEYSPSELGVLEEHQVNINSIKQLRPLSNNQPWGIFFIDFESKKLPIVLLRRLLSSLVPKNRSSAQSSAQPTWIMDDLLFVSLLGEEKNRQVCFSHFKETEKGLPVLQTFSWDEKETHFYYLKKFNLGSLTWPNDSEDSDTALNICKSMCSKGLLAKPTHGNIIRFAPPLIINEEQLLSALSIIKETLREFEI